MTSRICLRSSSQNDDMVLLKGALIFSSLCLPMGEGVSAVHAPQYQAPSSS